MLTIKPFESIYIDTAYDIEQQCHQFPWEKSVFLSNFGDNYFNLVMTSADEVVGYCITQKILDEATIFNIAISPKHQKQGLGHQLLAHLINELDNLGIKTLWLEVRSSNYSAIKLYEKLGFVTVTVRKGYYPLKKGREDAIVMALTIGF